jgi:hypothetical protein
MCYRLKLDGRREQTFALKSEHQGYATLEIKNKNSITFDTIVSEIHDTQTAKQQRHHISAADERNMDRR